MDRGIDRGGACEMRQADPPALSVGTPKVGFQLEKALLACLGKRCARVSMSNCSAEQELYVLRRARAHPQGTRHATAQLKWLGRVSSKSRRWSSHARSLLMKLAPRAQSQSGMRLIEVEVAPDDATSARAQFATSCADAPARGSLLLRTNCANRDRSPVQF